MAFIVSGLRDVCFSNPDASDVRTQHIHEPLSKGSFWGCAHLSEPSAVVPQNVSVISYSTSYHCSVLNANLKAREVGFKLRGEHWRPSCSGEGSSVKSWAWLSELGNSTGQSEGAMNPTRRGMTAPLDLAARTKPHTCHVMHQPHSNEFCESTINKTELRLYNLQASL